MTEESKVCPNCSTELVAGDESGQSSKCPDCELEYRASTAHVASPSETTEAPGHEIVGAEAEQAQRRQQELAARLPPKFLVADPEFDRSSGETVMIPDGKGGITSVKRNVVRVQHKGQTVELIALSPADRRRRQAFWNFVWVIAGVLFFWLVFSMI